MVVYRLNNFGITESNSEFIVTNLLTNEEIYKTSSKTKAYEEISNVYLASPLIIMAEPDGTLWHNNNIITNSEIFFRKALEIHPSVSVIKAPTSHELLYCDHWYMSRLVEAL
jgi:hypothetical protein